MATSQFYNGDTVSFMLEVRESEGSALFDPSSVTIIITRLRSVASDVIEVKVNEAMTKKSVGVYTYYWNSTAAGNYEVTYRVVDGTATTLEKKTFKIK